MDVLVERTLDNILHTNGLEKQNVITGKFTGSDEISHSSILVYQLPKAAYRFEVHTIYYQQQTVPGNEGSIEPEIFASALNVYINLISSGHRTPMASNFLFKRQYADDQQLQGYIQQLLTGPLATYSNVTSPMGKFLCINTEKLLNYLKPGDVAKLERVCSLFYNLSCSKLVDDTFWKFHYTKEYDTDQLPEHGYRHSYLRQKNAEKFFQQTPLSGIESSSSFMPPPHMPWRVPPNNPLQPLHNPHPRPSKQPNMPPFLGDVDNPDNWLPGRWRDNNPSFLLPPRFAPQGDPPEYLPNYPSRGIDPDMPIGPHGPRGGAGEDGTNSPFGGLPRPGGGGFGGPFGGGGGSFI